MGCPIERAQERDQEITAAALQRHMAQRAQQLAMPPRKNCKLCTHPIEQARLDAVPNAQTCIHCARKAERPPMARRRR